MKEENKILTSDQLSTYSDYLKGKMVRDENWIKKQMLKQKLENRKETINKILKSKDGE